MFPLMYQIMGDVPRWMAYVQWVFVVGLMGLTYLQVTRRRMGFMVMFGVMFLIFFVDIFAYLPFYAWLSLRDRRGRVTG